MESYFPPTNPSDTFIDANLSLLEKGYEFCNETRKLCQVGSEGEILPDQGFVFEVKKGDQAFNQKNYEEIGEIITDYVYGLLESMGLQRIPVPQDPKNSQSFVYVSSDFESNEKLAIFIHGSGVVRAGQWARKLIINENLDLGTIIPDVIMAQQRGFAVLIMNTNDNKDASGMRIKGCENAKSAAITTWTEIVSKADHVRHIGIIGHSYGGVVCVKLAETFPDAFDKLVFATLLTDSVHLNSGRSALKTHDNWINFMASDKPLNTDLGKDPMGVSMRSAGHQVHEWTPSSSRTCLFEHFDNLYHKHKQ